MKNKELKKLIEEEKSKSYFDGFGEGAENQKDLVELLLIGLQKVQKATTITEAKHWAKFYLIKSEKFRNV